MREFTAHIVRNRANAHHKHVTEHTSWVYNSTRGVVWEETIIFLPSEIKMVFLSATLSNATEFAEWICDLHKKPCHVVYTDFRPTPLQHYAFPVGGSGLYLIVDEKGQFREDNFNKLVTSFEKDAIQEGGLSSPRGRGSEKNGKGSKGKGETGTDVFKIVKVGGGSFSTFSNVYIVDVFLHK